jgi:hypothetical protein
MLQRAQAIATGMGGRLEMKDLKERTIRGGFAQICAQAGIFLLRVGSLMGLARLLEPKDFGLVGMVTALTLNLKLSPLTHNSKNRIEWGHNNVISPSEYPHPGLQR